MASKLRSNLAVDELVIDLKVALKHAYAIGVDLFKDVDIQV